MSDRRRRDGWDDWAREVEQVTPQTGKLATGSAAPRVAPTTTERSTSRRSSAYIITCEVSGCAWESAPLGGPNACHASLLAHAQTSHPPQIADAISVKIRSGRYRFPIEVVDV